MFPEAYVRLLKTATSSITERTKIRWSDGLDGISGKIVYTEDDGATWNELAKGTIVSMNFWGFTPSMMKEMENGFLLFWIRPWQKNPLKGGIFPSGCSGQAHQREQG